MERDFAKREVILEHLGENKRVAFLGPKGSGKSTTLCETFYEAQRLGKSCIYMDLAVTEDKAYCINNDSYVFIDNAQKLRKEMDKFKHLLGVLVQSFKVCLAYSPVLYDNNGGYTFLKSPVQHLIEIFF